MPCCVVQFADRQNTQGKRETKLEYPQTHTVTLSLTFSGGEEKEDREKSWLTNYLARPAGISPKQKVVPC
jgi:hypothetical protein